MAAKTVWGLDIGQGSMKAVRARQTGNRIEILAFDYIEYNLTSSDNESERDAAIRQALTTFLGRYEVGGDDILVCAPAHSALVRFIKLPPVEKKKIRDIVRYEAHQQIPFPLEEVIWDYQAIDRGFVPGEEVEVGIFAMRKELIHRFLSNLMLVNLEASVLQVAPISLYNFLMYERPPSAGAMIVIDIGSNNTDLLIVSQERVWARNLPIAGNDLTNAISREFNLPFEKAETLKRKAAKSKYQNKIYEAMKPALKGLIDELQRSIGYYKSVSSGERIDHILVMGSAFKLPGLARFLLNNLQYEVRKLGPLQNYTTDDALNIDQYRENPLGFGPALGLVTQALGKGSMRTNLMPEEIINRRILARKKPWAFVAGGILLAMVGWKFLEAKGLEARYAGAKGPDPAPMLKPVKDDTLRYNSMKGRIGSAADNFIRLGKNRRYWLDILQAIYAPVQVEPPIREDIDGKAIPPDFKDRNKIWIKTFAPSNPGPKLGDMDITLIIEMAERDMRFFYDKIEAAYKQVPFFQVTKNSLISFPEILFRADAKTMYISPFGKAGKAAMGRSDMPEGGEFRSARDRQNFVYIPGRRITYVIRFSAAEYNKWIKAKEDAAKKAAEEARRAAEAAKKAAEAEAKESEKPPTETGVTPKAAPTGAAASSPAPGGAAEAKPDKVVEKRAPVSPSENP